MANGATLATPACVKIRITATINAIVAAYNGVINVPAMILTTLDINAIPSTRKSGVNRTSKATIMAKTVKR